MFGREPGEVGERTYLPTADAVECFPRGRCLPHRGPELPYGEVLGVNFSPAMLAVAQQRAVDLGVTNVWFREGRKEPCYEDAARISGVS